MMDYAAHIAAEIAHLERMARLPGARAYARDKAEKMARWQPALYARLPEAVQRVIDQEKTHAL